MAAEQLADSANSLSPQVPQGRAKRGKQKLPIKPATPGSRAIAADSGLFPQKLLNVGFCAALILAAVCFIAGALYLNSFLTNINRGIETLINNANAPGAQSTDTLQIAISANLAMTKVALLSCGVFVGMSFGFLGFALFLIGIRQEINASGRYEGYYIKLARLSPGVFVILCASILIGVCVTHNVPFLLHSQGSQSPSNTNSQEEERLPTIDNSRPKTH